MAKFLTEEVKKDFSMDAVNTLLDEGLDYEVVASVEEDINENFEEYMAEWAVMNEGRGDYIEYFKKGFLPSADKAVGSKLTKVGLGVAMAAAAYLLYKAVRNKLDKCRKKCGNDPKCITKCRIDYQKGVIAALKKNMTELKKQGKLTDKKKAAMEKAIAKANKKIADYQKKLK